MKSELCANGVSPWRSQIRISISGDGRDLYSSQTGCGNSAETSTYIAARKPDVEPTHPPVQCVSL